MEKYTICVLPGDGIGPEVIEQAVRVLKALPVRFEFVYADIGLGAYNKYGTPLPDPTLYAFERADAALLGAVTTPAEINNYPPAVITLRKRYELYANLRPCRNEHIDLVIVRENTEGLYSGIERVEDGGDRAVTERVITRKGSERIIRFAFEYALKHSYKKVTVVHKANVLRESCGLFRRVAMEVAKAYPAIEFEEMYVDRCAMELIRRPVQFDVIVTTNMFGDILSDEAAMLVGGLGVAPSANMGARKAMFEPVHGSAPEIAGSGVANPIAAIRASKLMLEYFGLETEAISIERAVETVIKTKKVTPDLGGNLTTKQVADNIIKTL